MKLRFALGLCLSLGLTTIVTAEPLGKGAKAPAIDGELWVDAKGDTTAMAKDAFKAKVTVLEFFAYW
jgi:hypothetical protein